MKLAYGFIAGGACLCALFFWASQPVAVQSRSPMPANSTAETIELTSLTPVQLAMERSHIDLLAQERQEHWQKISQLTGSELHQEVANWLTYCEQTCKTELVYMPERLRVLVSDYSALQQHYEQVLGNLVLPHSTSLTDKVATIKQIQKDVWGDKAMWLYADQHALYDWQLAVEQLDQDDPDMLIASLPDISGLKTGRQQYEFLINKLPALSDSVKSQLAEQLLDPQENLVYLTFDVGQRERQKEVASYQQALSELEHQLLQHKNAMSESKWQQWRREQIKAFKIDFFSDEAELVGS